MVLGPAVGLGEIAKTRTIPGEGQVRWWRTTIQVVYTLEKCRLDVGRNLARQRVADNILKVRFNLRSTTW